MAREDGLRSEPDEDRHQRADARRERITAQGCHPCLAKFRNRCLQSVHKDSLAEEEGLELLVPPSKRTATRRAGRFVFWRPAAPAAIVGISESDEFKLPASQ